MSLEMRLRELNEARLETFPVLNKAAICAVVTLVALHVFKTIMPLVYAGIFLGLGMRKVKNRIISGLTDTAICAVIAVIASSVFNRNDTAQTVVLIGMGNNCLYLLSVLNDLRVEWIGKKKSGVL